MRAVASPVCSAWPAFRLSNVTSTPTGHHDGKSRSCHPPLAVRSQNIALLCTAPLSFTNTESRIRRIRSAITLESPSCPERAQSSGGVQAPKASRQQAPGTGPWSPPPWAAAGADTASPAATSHEAKRLRTGPPWIGAMQQAARDRQHRRTRHQPRA